MLIRERDRGVVQGQLTRVRLHLGFEDILQVIVDELLHRHRYRRRIHQNDGAAYSFRQLTLYFLSLMPRKFRDRRLRVRVHEAMRGCGVDVDHEVGSWVRGPRHPGDADGLSPAQ